MGSEIDKRRPAVIVSNDASNRAQLRVQIAPSAQSDRIYPWEAGVTMNGRPSKALGDQIRTVFKNTACLPRRRHQRT